MQQTDPLLMSTSRAGAHRHIFGYLQHQRRVMSTGMFGHCIAEQEGRTERQHGRGSWQQHLRSWQTRKFQEGQKSAKLTWEGEVKCMCVRAVVIRQQKGQAVIMEIQMGSEHAEMERFGE